MDMSSTPLRAASSQSNTGIKVSAVMPCLNEEETLEVCIRKVQKSFDDLGVRGEVVIADNGSTDRSVQIAESLGARVVFQEIKGYGAAIRKGIEAAEGECIIVGDSDDSYNWLDLEPFIRAIDEGSELVIGNRFRGGIEKGAMPPLHRYLGNPVLSLVAKVFFRVRIGDFHCGLRALRKDVFAKLNLSTTGMEFATEMIANAALQRVKIAEVPTTLSPDGRNRPPHLRSFRDGWRHLRFIFTYAPDFLYLVPAFLMLIPGILLMALLSGGAIETGRIFLGIHFLALGCLFSMAGINLLSFGLLAKIILKRRLPSYHSLLIELTQKYFSLERGIIASLFPLLLGVGIDITILFRWLSDMDRSMDDTVHIGFVATTLIVIGMISVFSSFLINMIVMDTPEVLEGDK